MGEKNSLEDRITELTVLRTPATDLQQKASWQLSRTQALPIPQTSRDTEPPRPRSSPSLWSVTQGRAGCSTACTLVTVGTHGMKYIK